MARRTATPLPAGKWDEHLLIAAGTFNPGETFSKVTALNKLIYGTSDYRPPESVSLLVLFGINSLKFIKILRKYLENP